MTSTQRWSIASWMQFYLYSSQGIWYSFEVHGIYIYLSSYLNVKYDNVEEKGGFCQGDSIKCERRVLHMCQFIAFISTLCVPDSEIKQTNSLTHIYLHDYKMQWFHFTWLMITSSLEFEFEFEFYTIHRQQSQIVGPMRVFFPYHKMINNMKCMLLASFSLSLISMQCSRTTRRIWWHASVLPSHFNCKYAKLKDCKQITSKRDAIYNEWKSVCIHQIFMEEQ